MPIDSTNQFKTPTCSLSQLDATAVHIASAATAAAHRLSQGDPRSSCINPHPLSATGLAQQGTGGGSNNKGGASGASHGGVTAAAGPVVAGVAQLRAAALRALRASVMAPCAGQRPAFLSQAVLLFKEAAGSVGQLEVSCC